MSARFWTSRSRRGSTEIFCAGCAFRPDGSLLDISRTWQQEFSVERATTRFYQEYASVRDRMAEALMAHNPDHPVSSPSAKTRPERGPTRQMGRVLFLWFLQAKQWLGEPGGLGSPKYLLDLWPRRSETAEGEYFRGILAPVLPENVVRPNVTRRDARTKVRSHGGASCVGRRQPSDGRPRGQLNARMTFSGSTGSTGSITAGSAAPSATCHPPSTKPVSIVSPSPAPAGTQ